MIVIALGGLVSAQDGSVRGNVEVVSRFKNNLKNADVVVWLTDANAKGKPATSPMARLTQKAKKFTPHVVAVTVGTTIEFPNQDPFFHDVFSIYHGKPFDLGLYESGSARKVKFSEPGVSYIFCNIHPEMSAVVVALSTPFFTTTGLDGSFRISQVPPGTYNVELWYEHASDTELKSLSREIKVTAGENGMGTLTLHAADVRHDHLNKYGEPYMAEKPAKY